MRVLCPGQVQRIPREYLRHLCPGHVQRIRLGKMRALCLGQVPTESRPELLPRLRPGHVEREERFRHELLHALCGLRGGRDPRRVTAPSRPLLRPYWSCTVPLLKTEGRPCSYAPRSAASVAWEPLVWRNRAYTCSRTRTLRPVLSLATGPVLAREQVSQGMRGAKAFRRRFGHADQPRKM